MEISQKLLYMINHIFMPPKLPQKDDLDAAKEHALCSFVHQAAEAYCDYLPETTKRQWKPMLKMLKNIYISSERLELSTTHITQSMEDMMHGDVFALLIRAQNAGIIMRRLNGCTMFESFEVSPEPEAVMAAKGRLLCSYPGPVVTVPENIVSDPSFREVLASFIVQMNVDVLDSAPKTRKARSEHVEERATAHPRYITELLSGILRGLGQPAVVTRIQKRIGDDVLWDSAFKPWRRSSIWLLIRVALQTSLSSEENNHIEYKAFMIYMMARMVTVCLNDKLPSHLLFCMRAKMSRRLYKIATDVPAFVLEYVRKRCGEVEKLLQGQWSVAQKDQNTSPPWMPEELNLTNDTRLSLLNSKSYLSEVLHSELRSDTSDKFHPAHHPRLHGFEAFEASDNEGLATAFKSDTYVALADFELAVQEHLDNWVSNNLHMGFGCPTISSCITQYYEAANKAYSSNPEDMSLMLLTIFDLLVGLDKMAVAQCHLLANYLPEIPDGLLDRLLLRRSRSFERLKSIQEYLRERHRRATYGSVFTDIKHSSSFEVRYVNESREHKALLSRIREEAQRQRDKKLVELSAQNARYKSLKDQSRALDCEYRFNKWNGRFHDRWCKRCQLNSEADRMQIEVHEWPLPNDPSEAKATVFELNLPIPFSSWRDTVFKVLYDICTQSPETRVEPSAQVRNYVGLREYAGAQNSRITIASSTKSFENSHYRHTRIPSEPDMVCVNNGLQYRFFDNSREVWAAGKFSECSIAHYCTLQLSPKSPYQFLQYAVDWTSHTSNEVLANQSDCPSKLTLHEYIAFGSLRSGGLLQWLNISREIRTRLLSFQTADVHTLLSQAMWQIGPLSRIGKWEWHSAELDSAEFGVVLLAELEDFLQSISANWLEIISARIIIAITSRLLASATDREVILRAYAFLRRVRDVTFGWMHQLVKKPQETEDSTIREFQRRACEVAATCRGTFDVEPAHAPFLLNSSLDIAILVECAIVVHDNTPPNLPSQTDSDFVRLLDRDRRLSHSLESLLVQQISHHRDGLDSAILARWAGYRSGHHWTQHDAPNNRWVTTRTTAEGRQVSQAVQYNLLDGCLLINGKPLGRLPKTMVNNAVYARIFGTRVLDVVPADVPGMDFATRDLISNHQVLFGFREDGSTLIIRAKHGPKLLELVPHCKFFGDLPTLLVEHHVHWLNIFDQKIELRPIANLWVSSNDNWWIHSPLGQNPNMCKARTLLIDIRSPTMNMVSPLMAPLEDMHYITVTYSPEGCLSIDLPRFRLCFFLNKENELELRNMPGMIIDADRSSGTMIGLFNQLVLRRTGTHILRRVLIPDGEVRFEPNGDHVKVTVDTTSQIHVRYHGYHIDSNLGRLDGDTSLISTLYQIYLHAVTSHCLPDPLTGRTGTEEALNMLSSAGCLSFQSLGPAEAGVLAWISGLTPDRIFYPDYLEVMQTVKWSNLTPTAQHPKFHSRSQFILDYAKRLSVFNGNSISALNTTSSKRKKPFLLERAQHLMKVFYPDDVADPQTFKNEDVIHFARHFHDKSLEEGVAATVSSLVHSWPSHLTTCSQLFDVFKGWGMVSGPNEGISIAYNRGWIDPDLSQVWLSLYNIFRGSSKVHDQYRLSFNLAALAYSSPESRDRDLISTILAFATAPEFATLHPPPWPSYNLGYGFQSTIKYLFEIIERHAVSFEDSPEAAFPALFEEDEYTLGRRRRSSFNDRLDSQAQELTSFLNRQWPCQTPNFPYSPLNSDGSWLFDMPNLKEDVEDAFLTWYQNSQLRDHIGQVQAILNESYCTDINSNDVSVHSFTPCSTSHTSPHSHILFDQLFQRGAPGIIPSPSALGVPTHFIGRQVPPKTDELGSLLTEFHGRNAASVFQRRYGRDLDQSRQSLSKTTSISLPSDAPYSLDFLNLHMIRNKQHFDNTLRRIIASLSPSSDPEKVMFTSGHWPRLTVRTLLGKLTFGSRGVLGDQWLQVLIALAEALLGLQRSHRLLTLARTSRHEELYAELQNQRNNVQNGKQHPDWLLIQVENDFLARPVQVQVAQEMISPRSRKNTALQLNMGEGKSSVIVPMVATALSNGCRFVRVVVLKPLATQMFQLLVKRLSGLANRRIFYMPFSRGNTPMVDIIQELNMECMRLGGILVAQPEHILSFKLMGIDRLFCAASFEERKIANRLLDSQHWLEENSRDILDESDELLYVKYQLVYTFGQQQAMEGHPDRWTTLQQILALLHKHAPKIKQQFPSGIEVEEACQGSYPHIRITQSDAGEAIISRIAQDVMMGMLPNCSFGLLPALVRQAALQFITKKAIDDDDQQLLQEHCEGTGSWSALLLLRGLLGLGILLYVLKERRWRVDYGLDPRRSLLAVPYKAKDVPSLRAEFGHPDVAVALTSLSYHYQGLSQNQVDQCFELLYKLDNPTLEYETWVSYNNSIPDVIRCLSGVNTQDPKQRRDIFPLFSHNHAVIDFFLSQVVFPKAAKEFPKKLATSAWDLAETKRTKQHLTTGFSGTNDRRYLLPTSIIQDDPIDQLSTNAKVLTYLLQPENNHYLCVHRDGQRLSTEGFLRLLTKSPEFEIRVLLDVGAQMLGLQNKELARYWLSLTPVSKVQAAIYFEENDELTVLSRDGSIEVFMSSPFNQQLDKCIVYLDDSHTRGTDLKLPRNFRAAVTLGPKVTKDRLLQGCMRMRKLGHGQSVMIFAPLEVDRGIREAAKKSYSDKIVALDILRWVMLETCKDIEHHIPHWVEQGVDYHSRRGAWDKFSYMQSSVGELTQSSIEGLKSFWLQPESRTLDSMYGITSVDDSRIPFNHSVPEIHARCQDLGVVSLYNAGMDEEQEREVQHEVEREREVERPPKVKPAEHQLHPHVRELVTSGWFDFGSTAFVPILSPLARFTAASPKAWSSYLLATKDFSTTVQEKGAPSGDYLRPVGWILSRALQNSSGILLVALSPYEVNELLPALRKSKAVHLHQYSPKVTRSMKPFDDLSFYCVPQLIPRWRAPDPNIKMQLNLWAGQLYLPDEETLSADEMPIQNDGFIKPEHRGQCLQAMSPFTQSPIPFLKELIGFRRKGMGYLSTPLGKILHAKLLTDDDFDE